MATTNLDAADLKGRPYQGLIREDVMDAIYSLDPVDLPYQDMAGEAPKSKNQYRSWTQDSLEAVQLANAVVDGADVTGNDSTTGRRIGNHHQESTKIVQVSDRARNVDTIGRSDELVYQLMERQKELKKRMEATFLSNQASVEDNGDAVAGKTAGCGAMFETNIINGTAGGFLNGIFSAPTPSASRAMTEMDVRNGSELAYTAGGMPSILMSVPALIRKLSEYLFSSSARIATIQSNVTPSSVKDGMYERQGVTAIGSVTTIITDFHTLELCPNRSQLTYTNVVANCNVYGFDPEYWAIGYLQKIMTKPLARTGLAEKRLMSVDYCNIAKNEKSSFVIMGINPALAVTAG
jgi:hypothetical protein